jgi:cytochrome c oxidase subunit 4
MRREIQDTLPGRPEGADLVRPETVPGGAQVAKGYETHHEDDHRHIVPLSTYYKIFGALMVLLIITVLAAEFDFAERVSPSLGWMNIVVALIIAVVKAALIILYFMHVKFSSTLIKIFAGGVYFFLVIMFLMTYADYFTRDWLNATVAK